MPSFDLLVDVSNILRLAGQPVKIETMPQSMANEKQSH